MFGLIELSVKLIFKSVKNVYIFLDAGIAGHDDSEDCDCY